MRFSPTQTDPKIVLHKWKQDFEVLYSKHDVANEFDDGFYRYCMLQKEVIESETKGDDNKALNCIMSEDEIQKAIEKLKLNKATGIDKIPNEILKKAGVHEILHQLL